MNLKLVSAGAGVFGFGALVGWALTADHFEQKMKTQREGDEISIRVLRNLSHHLDERCSALEALNQALIDEDALEKEISEADDAEEAPEMTDEQESEVRSNLQKVIDQYTADPSTAGEFVDTATEAIKNDMTPPFIIPRDKYAWDEEEGDQYDKITLTYYRRNRILVDEDEELIDDPGSVVGWRNLSRFGSESEDPLVVFVRNRRLLTDYEVVLDEENDIPLHIKYGMPKEEFNTHKAAGTLKLRPEDSD